MPQLHCNKHCHTQHHVASCPHNSTLWNFWEQTEDTNFWFTDNRSMDCLMFCRCCLMLVWDVGTRLLLVVCSSSALPGKEKAICGVIIWQLFWALVQFNPWIELIRLLKQHWVNHWSITKNLSAYQQNQRIWKLLGLVFEWVIKNVISWNKDRL